MQALFVHELSVLFRVGNATKTALADISFSVAPHEWLSVTGANGSGKSTLAKCIAGLLPISSGTITGASHQSVGIVLQNPEAQIVGETPLEDVTFSLANRGIPQSQRTDMALRILSDTGLGAMAEQPVLTLSGGQKQLLCIASTLALSPAVMVFDEATSMLDPLHRLQVIELAQALQRSGTAIVWVTQWTRELAHGARVLQLDDGHLAFLGSTQDYFYRTETANVNLPFAVQVARRLRQDGALDSFPMTATELADAVAKTR